MKRLLFCVLMMWCTASTGQQSIRLMSYNLLNFPTGNIPGRVDTLEKIVQYYQPHLLMIQELRTAQGLSEVADMMDDLGYGNFAGSQFVSNQSDPGNPYNLQQAIVYNTDIFSLKSQDEILTSVRDINEFVLYLNDADLENGADTTFLYVYVAHLKSSTGSENQALREDMVNAWRDHVEDVVPPGSFVIIAGDFNIYTNQEAAYEELTSTGNTVNMMDVFASYGNWTGSGFSHKEILTQSTRISQIYDDGAGGGVDDRFDFILFSQALMANNESLTYVDDSYLSLGNTGDCYNEDITDCSFGNEVPYEILQAIYYQSDHIPQVAELSSEIELSVPSLLTPVMRTSAYTSGGSLNLTWYHAAPGMYSAEIWDSRGTLVYAAPLLLSSANGQREITAFDPAPGIYLLRLVNTDGQSVVCRFFQQVR